MNIISSVENPDTVNFACSKLDPKYIGKNHQHILTGELQKIFNIKFKKKTFSKNHKYRDPVNLS